MKESELKQLVIIKSIDDEIFNRFNNLNFGGEIREGFLLFGKNLHVLVPIFIICAALLGVMNMLVFSNSGRNSIMPTTQVKNNTPKNNMKSLRASAPNFFTSSSATLELL